MKLVLDTNVILYHLANRLAAPLPPAIISASIISEMEALSYPTLTTIEEASIRQYIASLQLIELTTSITVSYTHLDVYKRQDHVVEFEERQRLLAVEPLLDGIEAQHPVDREMLADVAQ